MDDRDAAGGVGDVPEVPVRQPRCHTVAMASTSRSGGAQVGRIGTGRRHLTSEWIFKK
jgi:hypothetical protein